MMQSFQPGQKFRMTNPDYNVLEEEWTVEELSDDYILFACKRYWVRDIAYVEIDSTEPLKCKVLKELDGGVLLIDAYNRFPDWGYHIKGDEVTFLSRQIHANVFKTDQPKPEKGPEP